MADKNQQITHALNFKMETAQQSKVILSTIIKLFIDQLEMQQSNFLQV